MPFYTFTPSSSFQATASGTSGVTALGSNGDTVRVVNNSGQILHLALGGSGASAASADYSIPNGTVDYIRRSPEEQTHIALKLATGSGPVNVSVGQAG